MSGATFSPQGYPLWAVSDGRAFVIVGWHVANDADRTGALPSPVGLECLRGAAELEVLRRPAVFSTRELSTGEAWPFGPRGAPLAEPVPAPRPWSDERHAAARVDWLGSPPPAPSAPDTLADAAGAYATVRSIGAERAPGRRPRPLGPPGKA